MLTFAEFHDEELEEAVVVKNRIRGGRRQRVKVSSKKGKGWTLDRKTGREKRISPSDLKKMSIRNKRGARKKKGKAAMTAVKQRRSNAKRTGFSR